MLHAELHGKLSSEIGDAERREDVLTSSVFGTLFAASAWDVLSEWFSRARRTGSDGPPLAPQVADTRDYWFWPRLDTAEPDVIVQLGALIVVVEAKYFAGKGGASKAGEASTEKPADQLVREWHACSPAADRSHYDSRLRDALENPSTIRVLVYLVRRSRFAREHDALEESMAKVPEASMYLLTWEDLDEVLATRLHIRWANDLHRYLQRRGVGAFRGFRRSLPSLRGHILLAWAKNRLGARPDFARAIQSHQQGIRLLASRPSKLLPSLLGWKHFVSSEKLTLIHRLAKRPSNFQETYE